ncbi:MAG: hypothetical protein KC729_18590, partial [Candidatus Eisenbacteria bacterium]|nr:hypothetical protein [Candidatus Eisenbacteria bacterium]
LLHAALGHADYRARIPLPEPRARRAAALVAKAREAAATVAAGAEGATEEPEGSGAGSGRDGESTSRDIRPRGGASGATGRTGAGSSSGPRAVSAPAREVRPLPEDLRRKLLGQIDRLKENTEDRRRRSFPTRRVGATE